MLKILLAVLFTPIYIFFAVIFELAGMYSEPKSRHRRRRR